MRVFDVTIKAYTLALVTCTCTLVCVWSGGCEENICVCGCEGKVGCVRGRWHV